MNTATKTPTFNYTEHAWEGSKYAKGERLYGSTLSKAIRQELKEAFPKCKFSITSQTYSGGQSISIALMAASFSPFALLTDEVKERITLNAKRAFPYNWEEVAIQSIKNYKNTKEKGHYTVNQYHIKNAFYLTKEAQELFTKALKIAQSFNFDDSDAQIDYFHTNFYLDLAIGKWDKPFIQK